MRILHVTPHVPPDQAANALLPWQLGNWGREAGDAVEYVAHPSRAGGRAELAGPVTWLPRRSGGFVDCTLRIGSVTGAWRIQRALAPLIARADVVHAHSNGLLSEVAVLAAVRAKKPVVLTLYGTEIWHYQPKRGRPDLFTRAYHEASYVTFYSERLMSRAFELGLRRRNAQVVYPPVGEGFAWHDDEHQADERAALGINNRHLLLNVKRLHPLAGQRILIEAMMDVVHAHPDTRLVICGAGPLREELQAAARSAGVERHVDFTGLVDNVAIARYCAAADLFVLPSLLEALPTVAVEALACGTPVLSSDNPGGLELNGLFGPDVSIVPGEQPIALGKAITHFLQHKRRTLSSTHEVIEREFRPDAVRKQYWTIYGEVGTCR
jgi:glycosyltransferase involved in cell wall biosynthesis